MLPKKAKVSKKSMYQKLTIIFDTYQVLQKKPYISVESIMWFFSGSIDTKLDIIPLVF